DITSPVAPTVRDICELPEPAAYVRQAPGTRLAPLGEVMDNAVAAQKRPNLPGLLSPVDLQAVKASGVTFVVSLLERVIEEQAQGDPARAAGLRSEILDILGTSLSELVPGSET